MSAGVYYPAVSHDNEEDENANIEINKWEKLNSMKCCFLGILWISLWFLAIEDSVANNLKEIVAQNMELLYYLLGD